MSKVADRSQRIRRYYRIIAAKVVIVAAWRVAIIHGDEFNASLTGKVGLDPSSFGVCGIEGRASLSLSLSRDVKNSTLRERKNALGALS